MKQTSWQQGAFVVHGTEFTPASFESNRKRKVMRECGQGEEENNVEWSDMN
jgi:hypothetical protein